MMIIKTNWFVLLWQRLSVYAVPTKLCAGAG